jgi:hypothetical protein
MEPIITLRSGLWHDNSLRMNAGPMSQPRSESRRRPFIIWRMPGPNARTRRVSDRSYPGPEPAVPGFESRGEALTRARRKMQTAKICHAVGIFGLALPLLSHAQYIRPVVGLFHDEASLCSRCPTSKRPPPRSSTR